jgi:uncharacterized protein YacL
LFFPFSYILLSMLDIVNAIIEHLIDPLIALLFALGFALFVFGATRYFFTNEERVRSEARQHMLYSIIGLFIMLSVTLLMQFIMGLFGIPINSLPPDVYLFF